VFAENCTPLSVALMSTLPLHELDVGDVGDGVLVGVGEGRLPPTATATALNLALRASEWK